MKSNKAFPYNVLELDYQWKWDGIGTLRSDTGQVVCSIPERNSPDFCSDEQLRNNQERLLKMAPELYTALRCAYISLVLAPGSYIPLREELLAVLRKFSRITPTR